LYYHLGGDICFTEYNYLDSLVSGVSISFLTGGDQGITTGQKMQARKGLAAGPLDNFETLV